MTNATRIPKRTRTSLRRLPPASRLGALSVCDRREFLLLGVVGGITSCGLTAPVRGESAVTRPLLFYRHGSRKGEGKGTVSFTTLFGEPTHLLELPPGYIKGSMALSPDGRFLAYIEKKRLHLFDMILRKDHATATFRGGMERVHWRPDGKWIGLQSSSFDPMYGTLFDNLGGYAFDAKSGKIRWSGEVVTGIGDPSFSPDSTRVAYVNLHYSFSVAPGIRTAAAEESSSSIWPKSSTRGRSNLFAGTGSPKRPVWSPRGDLILFHAKPSQGKDHERTLWVADPEGKRLRQIASQRYVAKRVRNASREELESDGLWDVGDVDDRMWQAATWSPNGTQLVFKVHPTGEAIDRAPRVAGRRTLPAGHGFGFEVIPAPPPRTLVIERHDVDTGHTESITKPMPMPSYDQVIYWSPDGKSIAFTAHSAADAPLAIWTVNADGSDLRQRDISDVDEIVGWR